MTESYDITLDSVGYMVKPGTYQRYQDGQSEGRVGRVRLFDFYGGGKRTAQLERDRFLGGAGAWPTLDSQGIVAGPPETDRTLTPASYDPSDAAWSFAYSGTTYIVSGEYLYSVATSSGAFSDLSSVYHLPDLVIGCCQIGAVLWFAYGAATDVGSYDLSTSTYAAYGTSYKARLIGNHGAVLYLVTTTSVVDLRNVTAGTTLSFGAYIRKLVHMDGTLWVFTDQTLYKTVSSPEGALPRLGADDDCAWAVQHFGRLWTWISGEIMYYDTTDDSFHGTGIRGQGTRGACTVGSWLVVIVEHEISGDAEIWGYDGRGWWMLEDGTIDARNPVSIVGSC
ncbi:MAG: hypothetical protein WBW04_20290, partial [Nitrolancea sp.]